MNSFDESISFSKFFETYKQKNEPIIKVLEETRHNMLKKHIKAVLICVFAYIFVFTIAGICLIIPFVFDNPNPIFIIGYLILGTIAVFLPSIKFGFKCKEFKLFLKNKLLRRILSEKYNMNWHEGDQTNFGGIISNDILKKSALFRSFNSQMPGDQFEGSYKNVDFKIIETKLLSREKDSFNTIADFFFDIFNFKGIVINFKYNKKIKNRTIVSTKLSITEKEDKIIKIILFSLSIIAIIYFQAYKLLIPMIILACLSILNKSETLNKITLEDPNFNRRFKIYSSDEVEARYLVTPLFMELLNNLRTTFGEKNLKCSFFDDNLMIAISTKKDLFEIGDLYTSCNDPKFVMQFWKELTSIFKMIEYFKLNEKIYLT